MSRTLQDSSSRIPTKTSSGEIVVQTGGALCGTLQPVPVLTSPEAHNVPR